MNSKIQKNKKFQKTEKKKISVIKFIKQQRDLCRGFLYSTIISAITLITLFILWIVFSNIENNQSDIFDISKLKKGNILPNKPVHAFDVSQNLFVAFIGVLLGSFIIFLNMSLAILIKTLLFKKLVRSKIDLNQFNNEIRIIRQIAFINVFLGFVVTPIILIVLFKRLFYKLKAENDLRKQANQNELNSKSHFNFQNKNLKRPIVPLK